MMEHWPEGAFLENLQTLHRSGDLDVNAEAFFLHSDANCAPLHFATRKGWCTTMRWLLDRGADPDKGAVIRTPLLAAAESGRNDLALILLDAGAQVDPSFTSWHRPLSKATENGHEGTCKLLLSRGARLDTIDDKGRDAEAWARYLNKPRLAALFAAVRAAGGWKPYVDAPRRELLALRRELSSLRERGCATPSDDRLYERLFHETRVPEEIFTHVFSYWRTPRDA